MPYHYGESSPSPMSTTPSPMRALYGESSTTTTTPMPVSMSGYMSTTTTTPTPGECCTPTVLAKFGPDDDIPAGPSKGKLFRVGFGGWQAGDWWWGDKDNNIFTENNIDLDKPPTPLIVSTPFGCFKLNTGRDHPDQGLALSGFPKIPDHLAKIQPGSSAQTGGDKVTRWMWVKCKCCPAKDWRPVPKPPPPAKPTEPKPTEPKPTEPKPTEPKPGDKDKPIDTKPGGGAGPSDDEMERKRFEERQREAEEEDRKRAEMDKRPAARPDDVIPPKGGPGLGGKVPPVGGGVPRGDCCSPVVYWWACPQKKNPRLPDGLNNWLTTAFMVQKGDVSESTGRKYMSAVTYSQRWQRWNPEGIVIAYCTKDGPLGRQTCQCYKLKDGFGEKLKQGWQFAVNPSTNAAWEKCTCCPGSVKTTYYAPLGQRANDGIIYLENNRLFTGLNKKKPGTLWQRMCP